MKTLTLNIKTPEKMVFSGHVQSVTLPAVDGQIGVLYDHEPLATLIKKGKISCILEDGKPQVFECTKGVLIINKNVVSVLIR